MDNQNIFIVEDEKEFVELCEEVLSSDFNCISFNNAQEALKQFEHHKPKSIILDLNLPDMNGIEFCQALYDKYCSHNDVEVIFVSGDVSVESKLKAFEVGAADFLTKPFELKELLYKVKASVARKNREQELLKDVADNQKLIYTTMEQASQYSNVMSFFKNLSHCKSIEKVAEVFFQTMSQFGLHCSISTRIPTLLYFQPDNSETSPIEKDVYDLLKHKSRIFPFSNRMIINDEHVSFIIKNPPKDDHALGQVRDYVAAIIEGLEAKVLEIFSQSGMNNAINDLTANIADLKVGIHEHHALINSVMSNMLLEIASSYHSLEMTERQEDFLNSLIEKGTEQLSTAESHLVDIMTGLEQIKSNMVRVQQEIKETEINDTSDKAESNSELF